MKTESTITAEQFKSDIDTRTKIFGMFKSGDDISVSLIQRKCSTEYFTASRTLENLIEDGLVKRGKTVHDACRFL